MVRRIRELGAYGSLCSQIYDLSKPAPPADAFRYYLNECKKAKGSVLELMCGSGRFLIPLREQGIDIDGIDASDEMLTACRAKARAKDLRVRLYHQFIEQIKLPRRYNLIIIPASSFILVIDNAAVRKSLQQIYNHLVIGGKLLVEIDTPAVADARPGVWKGFWAERPDGATIVFSVLGHYDEKDKVAYQIHKYELFEKGYLTTTELEHYAMRFYEKAEFKTLLQDTGFSRIQVTKPYGNQPADGKDGTIMFEGYR